MVLEILRSLFLQRCIIQIQAYLSIILTLKQRPLWHISLLCYYLNLADYFFGRFILVSFNHTQFGSSVSDLDYIAIPLRFYSISQEHLDRFWLFLYLDTHQTFRVCRPVFSILFLKSVMRWFCDSTLSALLSLANNCQF